jgi:FkbM family methyltransferase
MRESMPCGLRSPFIAMTPRWTFPQLARGLRPLVRNWRRVSVVAWLALHGRPRRLFHTRLAGEMPLVVRLRDGVALRCRVNEFYAFLEIYVDREYDFDGWPWRAARVVVDVGANVGVATLWFAARAPLAKILSVEPSPRAVLLLRRNVAANGLAGRVQIREAAVGGKCGTGRVRDDGASVTATVEPLDSGGEVEVVPLSRLFDDASLERVDVLKLDCEGAEFGALLGADDGTLARVDAIVGEYHLATARRLEALVDHLEAVGFQVSTAPASATTGLFRAQRPPAGAPR